MIYPTLAGKTGIVTGGSSGIGFAIANVLAESDEKVYVVSRTGAPKPGAGESHPGVIHVKGDIADRPAMQALLAKIASENGGHFDFLINNAGVSYKCRAEDFPEDKFDAIMATNVKYVFQIRNSIYRR